MDCGRCGMAASPGDAFCRSCGTRLVIPALVEPSSPTEDQPSQRLQVAVGITIAIVVLATIIGIVVRDTDGEELQLADADLDTAEHPSHHDSRDDPHDDSFDSDDASPVRHDRSRDRHDDDDSAAGCDHHDTAPRPPRRQVGIHRLSRPRR